MRRFRRQCEIRIEIGAPLEWPGEFQLTSAPVTARDTVIVGSAIADNRSVEAPPGTVRAFDARTGRPRWRFDPLLHDGVVAGHANVWAPMSVDEARGLVFLPTSSPSPDFSTRFRKIRSDLPVVPMGRGPPHEDVLACKANQAS